ncbi:MAG: hypothetical protein WCC26_08255 [Terracidiphilus sp.]
MKRFFGFAILLASLSVPAFAAKNSQSISITGPVTVGATQLPAGNYKVSWTGIGSNAQVTIAEKGKASVTVPAKVVEAKNGHIAVLTNKVNGSAILETIQLNDLTIELTGATSAGE